eukprot:g6796.t1
MCPAGKIGEGGECIVCVDQHYEVNRTQCVPCPSAGVACSGGYLLPKNDFWFDMEALRATGGRINASTAFFSCPIRGICTMNASTGTVGMPLMLCRQGYHGTMCWNCEDGYGRSMSNQCMVCPNLSALRFAAVALAFAVLLLLLFTLKYSLRPHSPGDTAPPPVATTRIFVNYVYTLSLLGAVDIDWGERMKTLFATSRTASGGAVSFSDCFGLEYFHIL